MRIKQPLHVCSPQHNCWATAVLVNYIALGSKGEKIGSPGQLIWAWQSWVSGSRDMAEMPCLGCSVSRVEASREPGRERRESARHLPYGDAPPRRGCLFMGHLDLREPLTGRFLNKGLKNNAVQTGHGIRHRQVAARNAVLPVVSLHGRLLGLPSHVTEQDLSLGRPAKTPAPRRVSGPLASKRSAHADRHRCDSGLWAWTTWAASEAPEEGVWLPIRRGSL